MKHHLSIDIETKSSADISKTGLYRYAQDKDFGILLFAYKYDGDEVKVVDLTAGESIPKNIREAARRNCRGRGGCRTFPGARGK